MSGVTPVTGTTSCGDESTGGWRHAANRTAQLDDDIRSLREQIEYHRLQLAQAERALEENMLERASYAPVYTIPEDVLRLIFEVDFKHDSHAEAIAQLTGPCAVVPFADPLPVTHVCRRWRQTALALPTIWRCVHINETTCRHQGILETWFERSRSMSVRVVCEVGTDEELVRDRLRAALPKHASRLESFAILSCKQAACPRTGGTVSTSW